MDGWMCMTTYICACTSLPFVQERRRRRPGVEKLSACEGLFLYVCVCVCVSQFQEEKKNDVSLDEKFVNHLKDNSVKIPLLLGEGLKNQQRNQQ